MGRETRLGLGLALAWTFVSSAEAQFSYSHFESVCASEVSLGPAGACVLYSDGTVDCVGYIPDQGYAPPNWARFTKVDVGNSHICGLTDDEAILCWGPNRHGEADWQWDYFTDVSAGLAQTCGTLRADPAGRPAQGVKCWGTNWDQYAAYDFSGVVSDAPRTGRFTQVTTTYGTACALRDDGRPVCWGGDHGGNGSGQVTGVPAGQFVEITSGDNHMCGLRANGSVRCWGNSHYDQNVGAPFQDMATIAGGGDANCGLRHDGTAYCWGQGTTYTYAQGHIAPWYRDYPRNVVFESIAMSGWEACGITTDQRLECWGFEVEQREYPAIRGTCLSSTNTGGSFGPWW